MPGPDNPELAGWLNPLGRSTAAWWGAGGNCSKQGRWGPGAITVQEWCGTGQIGALGDSFLVIGDKELGRLEERRQEWWCRCPEELDLGS